MTVIIFKNTSFVDS